MTNATQQQHEAAVTLTAPRREKDRRLVIVATMPGGATHTKPIWIQDKEEREAFLDDLCATYRGIGDEQKSELRKQLNAIARENEHDIEVHPPHGKVNGRATTSIDYYAGAQLIYNQSGNLFDSKTRNKWATDIADLIIAKQGGKGKPARTLKLIRHFNAKLLGDAQRVRELPPEGFKRSGATESNTYSADETGIVLTATTKGPCWRPLTRFAARIVAEVTRNDGVELEREFEIEAYTTAKKYRFTVKAAKFEEMKWPLELIGASGLVYAGCKEYAREAIQILSTEVKMRNVYTHTGWMETEQAQWVYLHAGGVIAAGATEAIDVALHPALSRYELPAPPSQAAELRAAVRASLDMLNIAPASVIYPVYAAIWRAIIGHCDLGVFVAGPSGTFKSELSALAQQHFGAGMDRGHLPANWSSTANSLEGMAFSAKDAILSVDDFAPCGTIADVQRLHYTADRLFRAQGNHSGRQRSNADGSVRASKPPRGMILATGEDIPRGQSLRARLMIVEVSPHTINADELGRCQRDARQGIYAAATAAFIRWQCEGGRIAKTRENLRERIAELREQALAGETHRRTPDVVANLAIGLEEFLAFARQTKAISDREADVYWQTGWKAIGEAAGRQKAHQTVNEPATRFLQLVLSAIRSGAAHLTNAKGQAPGSEAYPAIEESEQIAGYCGWRRYSETSQTWEPQGARIGWIVADQIYLDPDASYKAAQLAAGPGSDALVIQPNTLRLRLKEKGYLLGVDPDDGRTAIRKRIGAATPMVLWISPRALPLYTARTARTPDPNDVETPFSDDGEGSEAQ